MFIPLVSPIPTSDAHHIEDLPKGPRELPAQPQAAAEGGREQEQAPSAAGVGVEFDKTLNTHLFRFNREHTHTHVLIYTYNVGNGQSWACLVDFLSKLIVIFK